MGAASLLGDYLPQRPRRAAAVDLRAVFRPLSPHMRRCVCVDMQMCGGRVLPAEDQADMKKPARGGPDGAQKFRLRQAQARRSARRPECPG